MLCTLKLSKLKTNSQSVNLFLITLLLFELLIKPSTISAYIVPKIEEENYKLLPTTDNKYELRIVLHNGSERVEFVELKNTGQSLNELSISGTTSTIYSDDNKILTVIYTADKNGYIASYKYEGFVSAKAAFGGASFSTSLSAATLKIAAG